MLEMQVELDWKISNLGMLVGILCINCCNGSLTKLIIWFALEESEEK